MATPSQLAEFNQAVILLGNALEAAGGMYHTVVELAAKLQLEGPPPGPTVYSQRNPTWSADKMGTSTNTMGLYGCMVSAVASILTDAGHVINPGELNAWLNSNGGYTGGKFVLDSVSKLGVVKYANQIFCPATPAPMNTLDPWIIQGNYAIVEVDFKPDPKVDEHWLRYLGGGLAVDPWYGDIASIVPRYKGKDTAEAILRIVMYSRVNPRG